ncbi:MAG: GNAT family N-acetyltransferase [Nitrospirae bacterium]|nr:GNAT family N-acetyltransferase [Nitrospirota bacterium]
MMITITEVTTREHISIIEKLAYEIWTEHYIPIIGIEQVEYMLEKYQSNSAIFSQIKDEGYMYFLMENEKQAVGYIAVLPGKDGLFLSKFYVHSSYRKRGIGKKALDFIEQLARNMNLKKIYLTVNKNNKTAITVYEKLGFINTGSIITDIGNGFVMDDYKMEKVIKL